MNATSTAPPLVRVVVLNFDGGAMTLDCLDSLLATDWPADRLEIVMVDNGSLDDVVAIVASTPRYSGVRVLEPLANLGFAGGCNLGMRLPGDHEYVALVNNDATVAPGWLRALVGAAAGPRVGAVSAKMLFADQFHGVELLAPDARQIKSGDPRDLGVRVTAVRLDDAPVDARLDFDEGFHGEEPPVVADGEEIARWTGHHAALRIAADPAAPPPSRIAVRVSCLEPRAVTVRSDVDERTVEAGIEPQWVDVAIAAEPFDVINNVGSNLFAGGFGGDRGFLEVDRGQYDEPTEVFAWCGGAVLLRRDYLDDVGLFDERLFLYYEDTDLAWRGRLRGWSYVYEPGAVVRHHHATSSGVGSSTFRYHTERNRLLVLAKNAPARLAWRAGLGETRRALGVVARHYVKRPLTLRLPARAEVAHRWRVYRGYLRLLPAMLADRWSGGRSVARRDVMVWEVEKWPTR